MKTQDEKLAEWFKRYALVNDMEEKKADVMESTVLLFLVWAKKRGFEMAPYTIGDDYIKSMEEMEIGR